VPEILREKRVITLDLALMVAGTKYRGQFEERIKAVMDEIKRSKNVILFVDELHTIVGAGSAEGAMDASNIIKPALSRGELQWRGRDDDERVPQIHRERRGVGAAVPDDPRRAANGGPDGGDPQGAAAEIRGAPPREIHRRGLEAASRLSDRYITVGFCRTRRSTWSMRPARGRGSSR